MNRCRAFLVKEVFPGGLTIPFVVAIALATAAETWSRITGNDSPMSVEAIHLMNARLHVTAAKAEKELGVTFRPFSVTLADTVAWARTRLQEGADQMQLTLSASGQKTA
jgi:dihydroflavonol-4-reductase